MSILDTAKDLFGNIKLDDLKPKEPNLDDPLTKAFRDNIDYYDEMGANTPEAKARSFISAYLGINDASEILNNQAIVNVDDDGGISVTDRYPNSAFGSAEVMYIPGFDSPVVWDPHRNSFFKVRMKNKRQKGRHGSDPVYRDYISVEKINELTEMDLTESLATKERQMQEVLSNSFGYQAGEGVFYGELAFLSLLGPAIAKGIYNLPTTSKRAANYIYKKYDEIVNKVKNNEIDPDVAKTQLNGLNDQAKVLVDEMGVTNKHQNQILQMIAGKNVANISKTGDFTDVLDVRTAPGGRPKGTENLTQEQKDKVIKLKTENPNITTSEIMELTGMGKSSVGDLLTKAGLTSNNPITPDAVSYTHLTLPTMASV